MAEQEKSVVTQVGSEGLETQTPPRRYPSKAVTTAHIPNIDSDILKAKWYRSSFYNALILGICNFLAPGIWG